MILNPRYGDRPIMVIDVRTEGEHPVMRQRRRLEALLRSLSEEEWLQPSRCEGWSVQDVVTHLTSTNGFWAVSLQAGLAGEPSRYLAAFDPVASPAQLVDASRGTPTAETMERFAASTEALGEVIGGLGAADWDRLAEAPPGHVPVRLVADHALWDAWVHERDIVLPLGQSPVVDSDEVLTSLRYCSALGRAFLLDSRSPDRESAVLEVTDPQARVVVTVEDDHVRVHAGVAPASALVVRGHAVELLDMLSIRKAARANPAGLAWFTGGLSEAFDQRPSDQCARQ